MGGGGGYQPMTFGGMGSWFNQPQAIDVNSMSPLQMMMFQQAMASGRSNVPVGSVWE
jgi:hypothetical protein